jgi:cytochrome P450
MAPQRPGGPPGLVITPHRAANTDPRHWEHPDAFDPDRYRTAPASDADGRSRRAGLVRCPFDTRPFPVRDGRAVTLSNGEFGAVYGEGNPVCDTAGYAPFGFGYRRCPAEQLTVAFVKEFLRKAWRDRLTFVTLGHPEPQRLPAGGALVDDDLGFTV